MRNSLIWFAVAQYAGQYQSPFIAYNLIGIMVRVLSECIDEYRMAAAWRVTAIWNIDLRNGESQCLSGIQNTTLFWICVILFCISNGKQLQAVVNGFGMQILAGFSVAMRIETLCIVPMSAIGSALSSYIAQNIGANKKDRVSQGYRAANIMVILIAQWFGTPCRLASLQTSVSRLPITRQVNGKWKILYKDFTLLERRND